MSVTTNMRDNRENFRWQLLGTVSAAALLLSVYGAGEAQAADGDRPLIWIDFGTQYEQFGGGGAPFAPPFVVNSDWKGNGLISPADQEKTHLFSFGGEAGISFQPEGSDWVFSGSVLFGRASSHRFVHQQLPGQPLKDKLGTKYVTGTAEPRYAQTNADTSEQHTIIDFQAGKDVGLGVFGSRSTSTLSLGVRYAQFASKSNSAIRAKPDVLTTPLTFGTAFRIYKTRNYRYYGTEARDVEFRGIGPSISWNASTPFVGDTQNGELTLDWGVNAALLFGRQRAKTHHHTSGAVYGVKYTTNFFTPNTGAADRKRSVIVPNAGGFAGLSLRYADAKVSIGYRGDFFFGAMDNGLDTRKSQSRSFYGPFASISVGFP